MAGTRKRGRLHVGTSGWAYRDWRGRFYPNGLPQRRWLEHYQRRFDAVELNVTFYRLPRATVFRGWSRGAPAGFRFAVKGPRLVTHYKRLRDARSPTKRFLSRARRLGASLGPVLWQLPPQLERDRQRLDQFLAALPRGFQHVIEFRHPSWFHERVYAILRKRRVPMVLWHMRHRRSPIQLTARSVYLRFHGTAARYGGRYGGRRLGPWASRIDAWLAEGREVWAFFNNDVGGCAVEDAAKLRELLSARARRAARAGGRSALRRRRR